MTNGKLLCAAAILAASSAMAQGIQEQIEEVDVREALRRPDVFAGIGMGNYTGDLGDLTDTGLAWNARVGFQPTRNLGAEVSYQGLRGDVGALIVPPNITLTDQNLNQHQFTADALVSVPVMVAERELRPYGLIGLGYTRLTASSGLESVGLDDDNVFAIPLGAGATYEINDTFMVDGRLTYNFLNGLDQPLVGDDGDSWSALVNVGASFGRR